MTESDFTRFRDFFYRKNRIMFGDNKRYFVDKRLQERMLANGADRVPRLFNTLRFQASGRGIPGARQPDDGQRDLFLPGRVPVPLSVRSILPEIARTKRRGEPVRIWSVPCSTGESPYSIAFQLLDNWADVDHYDVEIVASDIDTHVIEQAKRGFYGERSVQHVPRATLDRFTRGWRGAYEVIPDIRDSIAFTRSTCPTRSRPDIYATSTSCSAATCSSISTDAFRSGATRPRRSTMPSIPEAFVCLGHSESMSRISSLFAIRKFAEAIV